MGKCLKYLLLPLLLLFSAMPAQAAWYQVEVIIFDYLYPDLDGELWFENPGLPLRVDSIELIDALPDEMDSVEPEMGNTTPEDQQAEAVEPVPYLLLPEAKYRLKDVWRVLRLSRDYRPLMHVAWQQEGQDRERTRAVHLEKPVESDEAIESLPPELAAIQIEEGVDRPPELIFDGNIRLRASRFLHVDVDFAYFPRAFRQLLQSQAQNLPDLQNRHVNIEADYVRLTESRRLILDELHYFDHVLFGVILQVSRLQEN
jgi:hypothetical protein